MARTTSVSYNDEKTQTKVMMALHGDNDLDFSQVLAAVVRMQDAGILFREEVPEDLRPSRKAKGTDESVETPDPSDPAVQLIP